MLTRAFVIIVTFSLWAPSVSSAGMSYAAMSLPHETALPAYVQPPDPRFGAIEPHDAPEAAAQLGLAWGRARFNWAWVQPDGPDDWVEVEFAEADLQGEMTAGREVVGLLIGIPDWARDPDTGLPRGLYLPHDDPGNTWAGFVRAAVSRYAGRINHWIIWNEPDVWDETNTGYTWPGTVEDFVQLMRTAYLTARAANPGAVVHMAAMSHWWDVEYGRELYFKRLLDALRADPDAAANGYYFDAATVHFYFNPAQVFELVELYRGMLAGAGMGDKPLWLVETNAAPSDDPAWPVAEITKKVSLDEQAAYMPQALALALAAGAARVGIYKLIDIETDLVANPEPFGLLRLDGSKRPVFETTRVALAYLRGAEAVQWVDRHTVGRAVWQQGSRRVTMLWSRLPEWLTARLPAQTAGATLVDAYGKERPLAPQDGEYVITLPAAPCQQTVGDYCMIGGPPVYLVEALAAGAPIPAMTGDGVRPESSEPAATPYPAWPWQ
ncbi:MAG: hypothetical protein JXB47_18125 [Anaerolineae bacterium]|nr:hypothetical protein [Anaerolineae bacterium]